MARQLGCDEVLQPGMPTKDRPWASDPTLVDRVRKLTGGAGVDVAMEMAGFNSALNNAIKISFMKGFANLRKILNSLNIE